MANIQILGKFKSATTDHILADAEEIVIDEARLSDILGYEAFDSAKSYGIGEHVAYGNKIYVFTSEHSAGAWNASHVSEKLSLQAQIDAVSGAADAMIFKGTIGSAADNPTVTSLPNTHKAGWTYKVITAGTYASKTCEVGDLIICIADGSSASDNDWTVAQTNIDGAVTGPASSTNGNIPVFNGTSGKVLGDGYSVSKNTVDDSQTSIPTNSAVKAYVGDAISENICVYSGVISTSSTSVNVNYEGNLISVDATMSGSKVILDVTYTSLGNSQYRATFSCAQAPASPITCIVIACDEYSIAYSPDPEVVSG